MSQRKWLFKRFAIMLLSIFGLSIIGHPHSFADTTPPAPHKHHKHHHHKDNKTEKMVFDLTKEGEGRSQLDTQNEFYQVYQDEKGVIRVSFNVAPREDYYKKTELEEQRQNKRVQHAKQLPIRVFDLGQGQVIYDELKNALETNPMDIFERYDYWISRTLSNDFGYYFEESRYDTIFKLIKKNLEIDKEKQFAFFRHIASIYYTFYAHRVYPIAFPKVGIPKAPGKSLLAKLHEVILKSYGEQKAPVPMPHWIPSDFFISRIFYNAKQLTEDDFELRRMANVFIHSIAFDYYMRNQSFFTEHLRRFNQYFDMFQNMTMGGTYNTEFNASNAMNYNYVEFFYRPIYIDKLEKTQKFYKELNESLEEQNLSPKSEDFKEVRKAKIHEKHRAIRNFMKRNKSFISEVKVREDDELNLFLLVLIEKLQDYGPDYQWKDVLLDLEPLVFHKDFDFFKDFVANTYFTYIISGNHSSSYVRLFNPNDQKDLENFYNLLDHSNFTNFSSVNKMIIQFMKIHGRKLEKRNKDVPNKLMTFSYKGSDVIPQYDWEIVVDTINNVMDNLPYIQ